MSNLKRKLNALTLSDKMKIINEIDKGMQKKNQIAADFGYQLYINLLIRTCGLSYRNAANMCVLRRARQKKCIALCKSWKTSWIMNFLKSLRCPYVQ